MGAGFDPLPLAVSGVFTPSRGWHTLDKRGIAIQGVGFGPRLVGLQGLWKVTHTPFEPPVTPYLPQRKKRRRDTDDDVLLFILR